MQHVLICRIGMLFWFDSVWGGSVCLSSYSSMGLCVCLLIHQCVSCISQCKCMPHYVNVSTRKVRASAREVKASANNRLLLSNNNFESHWWVILINFLFSGNPKRYASRGIIRMAPDGRPFQDQRLEVPQEAIETEGDRQLKQLVQQQLETNVTVHGWEVFCYINKCSCKYLSLNWQCLMSWNKAVTELCGFFVHLKYDL